MKIIDKFYSFIHISMARKCKDCPQKTEQEKYEEHLRERDAEIKWEEPPKFYDWKKKYFFPNEWIMIEAYSYKEALNILNSTNQ